MFEIGDKIVYPMHGAGVIKAIEEKEFLGGKQQYYVINMVIGNMQLMVPVEKESALGIRSVIDMITMEDVLFVFHHGETDTSLPWGQRYRVNMDKIRTGNTNEGAEVVRDLTRRQQEKMLNTSEKRMLENAREILISELALVKGITSNQAKKLLT